MLIGSHRDNDHGPSSGSAYVFERTGSILSQEAKLAGSDVGSMDYFGRSVSSSGDILVVGASSNNSARNQEGAAYAFPPSERCVLDW